MFFLRNFEKIQRIRRVIPPSDLRGIIRFVTINYSNERITVYVHPSFDADNLDYLRYIFWSHTNSAIEKPFDIHIEEIHFPPLHPRFGCNRHRFRYLGNPHAQLTYPAHRRKRLSTWENELAAHLVPPLVVYAQLVAYMINIGPPPLNL